MLDPGFKTQHLIAFGVSPTLSGYSVARARSLYKTLAEELSQIPGVQSVTTGQVRLLSGNGRDSSITVAGYQPKDGEDMNPWVNTVGTGYFATLGIPLIAGREFVPSDERPVIPETVLLSVDFNRLADRERFRQIERELGGPPKYAIVNESFAKYYFQTAENAIGRHFGFGGDPGTPTDIEIIGVVGDTAYGGLRDEIPRQVFVPQLQSNNPAGVNVYVRFADESAPAFSAIRRVIAGIDSSLPIFELHTMDEQIDRSLFRERKIATLSIVFGVIATILATVGLYGVMSYSVGRRTREIGIRMALGAYSTNVVGMVMCEAMSLIGLGLTVGVVCALVLTRFIEALLFGLSAMDPLTIILSIGVLAVVAGLAGYIPALRASRVNPIRTLRYE
jgi:predicted permease